MAPGVELYFHIGLIKTGTTFLQSQIFPSLPDIRFFNSKQKVFGPALFADATRFLISDERMSGNPFLARQRKMSYRDQFFFATSRLKRMHPKAKVICCFREPAAFMQSAYKQYLHEGGTLQFESFFDLSGEGVLNKQDLLFSHLMNHLQREFEEEDLFAYDFDDFQDRPGAVLAGMFEFLGIEADATKRIGSVGGRSNPSVPLHLEPLLIRLNRLSARFRKATGRHLQLRIAGKTLNGRVFSQYVAPKFWKGERTRDLDALRSHFHDDWQLCKSMMRQFYDSAGAYRAVE